VTSPEQTLLEQTLAAEGRLLYAAEAFLNRPEELKGNIHHLVDLATELREASTLFIDLCGGMIDFHKEGVALLERMSRLSVEDKGLDTN
jgi:hypothetical protein